MARQTAVPITPSVLTWAIKESGRAQDEVAERLRISAETLDAWREGKTQPGLTQLKRLATVLARPPAVFLLPEPPKTRRPSVEFRHRPGLDRVSLTATELRHLRQASRLQRALAWVCGEVHEPTQKLPEARIGSDPEHAATATRVRLNVSVDQQLSWESASVAVQGWRSALEASGVLVFLLPLGKPSCQGFSLWDERAPLIAVNTWWNPEARIFTLFHEYGHLLTRTNSACLDGAGRRLAVRRDGAVAETEDVAERWCERFAASVLLPWDAVASFLRGEFGWQDGKVIKDLDAIRRLARRFKVSLRAATLRLIGRRVATWDLYAQIPAWSDEKTRGRGRGRKRSKVREDTYGRRTAALFVSSLREDVLTRTDVLSYLDVTDADLEAMEHQFATH